MKTTSWKWLPGLGLATIVSLGAVAQGHHDGHHKKHDGDHDKHHHTDSSKRNLSDKLYRVTEADSLQKQKMKPCCGSCFKKVGVTSSQLSKTRKAGA